MENIEPSYWKEVKEEVKIGKQIIYLPFNQIKQRSNPSMPTHFLFFEIHLLTYLSIIPSLVWPLRDKRESEWERNETTVLTHTLTLRDIEHNDDHLKLEHYNWGIPFTVVSASAIVVDDVVDAFDDDSHCCKKCGLVDGLSGWMLKSTSRLRFSFVKAIISLSDDASEWASLSIPFHSIALHCVVLLVSSFLLSRDDLFYRRRGRNPFSIWPSLWTSQSQWSLVEAAKVDAMPMALCVMRAKVAPAHLLCWFCSHWPSQGLRYSGQLGARRVCWASSRSFFYSFPNAFFLQTFILSFSPSLSLSMSYDMWWFSSLYLSLARTHARAHAFPSCRSRRSLQGDQWKQNSWTCGLSRKRSDAHSSRRRSRGDCQSIRPGTARMNPVMKACQVVKNGISLCLAMDINNKKRHDGWTSIGLSCQPMN